MQKKAVFILFICFFNFSFTKIKNGEKEKSTKKENIDWISINEVQAKLQKETRPILIDLYTNWCYWCKVMNKKTYSNSNVIEYINKHYYAVRLNAETKDSVVWNGAVFKYSVENKVNEFSIYITQGQLAFPNTVIFTDLRKAPASIPGFIEPKEIEVILKYFGEGSYKNKNFNEYSSNFKTTW